MLTEFSDRGGLRSMSAGRAAMSCPASWVHVAACWCHSDFGRENIECPGLRAFAQTSGAKSSNRGVYPGS